MVSTFHGMTAARDLLFSQERFSAGVLGWRLSRWLISRITTWGVITPIYHYGSLDIKHPDIPSRNCSKLSVM